MKPLGNNYWEGNGSPEGVHGLSPGSWYEDKQTGNVYLKLTPAGTRTGWRRTVDGKGTVQQQVDKGVLPARAGAKGDPGEPGAPGAPGEPGADGAAATIAIHSVVTGEPGTDAEVENLGNENAASLRFTIPRGDKGEKGDDGEGGSGGGGAYAPLIPIPDSRYWRIFIVANNGEVTFTAAVGIRFFAIDGSLISTTGTTITGSSQNAADFAAANAFKPWSSDSSGYWSSLAGSVSNQWLKVDFGAGNEKAVYGFTMTGVRDPTRVPKDFRLEYSSDNINWTTALTALNQSGWALGGTDTRTYSFPEPLGFILRPPRTATGTSETILPQDAGGVVRLTSASAVTMTLPNTSKPGFKVTFIQSGAGQVTLSPQVGATRIHRQGHTKTAGQGAVVNALCETNTSGLSASWVIWGDTAA